MGISAVTVSEEVELKRSLRALYLSCWEELAAALAGAGVRALYGAGEREENEEFCDETKGWIFMEGGRDIDWVCCTTGRVLLVLVVPPVKSPKSSSISSITEPTLFTADLNLCTGDSSWKEASLQPTLSLAIDLISVSSGDVIVACPLWFTWLLDIFDDDNALFCQLFTGAAGPYTGWLDTANDELWLIFVWGLIIGKELWLFDENVLELGRGDWVAQFVEL